MHKLSRRDALLAGAVSPFWITQSLAAISTAVAEAAFVRIGGIDQWISFKGENLNAPVALFLHGGPGEAMSPFLETFSPYAQDFTWAIWDQRGSGRTYGRHGDATPNMEAEQFVQDTIELAEHLRRRFAKEKIVLVGQSWGAALGLEAAKRRPELFHIFVGSGQPVSNALGLLSQERYAREVFTKNNDAVGLKLLDEASALPPTDPKRRFAVRKILIGDEDGTFLARESAFIGPKPYPTKGPIAEWVGGYTFTSNVLVPKNMARPELVDIVGYDIPLPVVIIQGKDDRITPTDVARSYFEKVKAPAKAFMEVRGGHFCFYTNQTECLAALREHVLLLAQN